MAAGIVSKDNQAYNGQLLYVCKEACLVIGIAS